MNIHDVTDALRKGIANTHHMGDSGCTDDECYCGASEDRKQMQDAIDYIYKIAPALRVVESMNFPQDLWRKIEIVLQKNYEKALVKGKTI